MTIPKLTIAEYSELVTDWNRRVKRGAVEPCGGHDWARIPQDSDSSPKLICVNCMRRYTPDIKDHRKAEPAYGLGAVPPDGRQGGPL